MISQHMQDWTRVGDFNGLGFLAWEYDSPVKAFDDTYDAEVVDGEWAGGCVCPHCQAVGNHYTGSPFARDRQFECGDCSHRSDV